MKVEPQQLKAFLADAGLATKEQFEMCAKEAQKSNKRVEEVLVEQKIIDQDQLLKMKAYILGIPFVNLEKETIPSEVLNLIPEQVARANNIVAFRRRADSLEVAMLDPEDLQIIESIKKTTGLIVLPRLTNAAGLKNALAQYQKTLAAEVGNWASVVEDNTDQVKMVKDETEEAAKQSSDLKKVAEEVPVIRIVDSVIKHAILEGASDIHIEPTEKM